jgi:hypothetical protein
MAIAPIPKDGWKFRVARRRASRLLKEAYPQGWRIRIAAVRGRIRQSYYKNAYKKGAAPYANNISSELFAFPFFITATRYLAKSKKEVGKPYLKLFLHPTKGRLWTLSCWSDVKGGAKSLQMAQRLLNQEVDPVFDCMETLKCLMNSDEMMQMVGIAKARELPRFPRTKRKTKNAN